jgi:hypothetical protein
MSTLERAKSYVIWWLLNFGKIGILHLHLLKLAFALGEVQISISDWSFMFYFVANFHHLVKKKFPKKTYSAKYSFFSK